MKTVLKTTWKYYCIKEKLVTLFDDYVAVVNYSSQFSNLEFIRLDNNNPKKFKSRDFRSDSSVNFNNGIYYIKNDMMCYMNLETGDNNVVTLLPLDYHSYEVLHYENNLFVLKCSDQHCDEHVITVDSKGDLLSYFKLKTIDSNLTLNNKLSKLFYYNDEPFIITIEIDKLSFFRLDTGKVTYVKRSKSLTRESDEVRSNITPYFPNCPYPALVAETKDEVFLLDISKVLDSMVNGVKETKITTSRSIIKPEVESNQQFRVVGEINDKVYTSIETSSFVEETIRNEIEIYQL